MNAEVKQEWLAALRSGEYQQTQGTLRNDVGYCCLGVLCDVAAKAGVVKVDESRPFEGDPDEEVAGLVFYSYGPDNDRSSLPADVVKWAGLNKSNPRVRDAEGREFYEDYEDEGKGVPITLAGLNDNLHYDFEQIAKIIEDQL